MYIIGIAEGSGSGKSSFSDNICKAFKQDITVLRSDNYYYLHDDISFDEREQLNYDSLEAIDFSLMVEYIKVLKNGSVINSPVYDFTLHTRSDQTVEIQPADVLIL